MSSMKWWGWGLEGKSYGLKNNPEVLSFLKNKLGIDCSLEKPVRINIEDIDIPEIALPTEKIQELKEITRILSSDYSRLIHSFGKSYKDLIRLRKGQIGNITDLVAVPKNEKELEELLKYAYENNIKIIPFGGGTSVVSGIEPLYKGTITLSLKKFNRVLSINRISRTAHIQAGIKGPDLENILNNSGFTLGHFPQSFEFSTLGGWIATRSAGQNSTKYGKIEDMVEALTLYYPKGKITTKITPASASGSDVKQILIGSEGCLGVITDAVVRIHPLPEKKHYCIFLVDNFKNGVDQLRILYQQGIIPAVARLSDPEETFTMMNLGSLNKKYLDQIKKSILTKYLDLRGYSKDQLCMLLLGFEGNKDKVRFDFKRSKKIVDGVYLGTSPGKKWLEKRFELPYLRDELMDLGVLVETLETATNWDNIDRLHRETKKAIREAIQDFGVKGLVQTHVSHIYHEGASLYYTFLTKAIGGKEIEQWNHIKSKATAAILKNGGTISHHHGIGNEHKHWMEAEHGREGLKLLKTIKTYFDPLNIMNPGKMNLS